MRENNDDRFKENLRRRQVGFNETVPSSRTPDRRSRRPAQGPAAGMRPEGGAASLIPGDPLWYRVGAKVVSSALVFSKTMPSSTV